MSNANPNTQETEHEDAAPDVSTTRRMPAPPASPLDASLMRGNPRQRQDVSSLWDAPEQLRVPSQALDAGNIRAHDQFEALEGFGCEQALAAMMAMQEVTKKVVEAREAYKAEGIKHEAEQVLDVFDLHSKLAPAATRKVDAANRMLDAAIAHHEGELRKAIRDGATGPFAAEIRTMLRSMTLGERQSFVTQAIAKGDGVAIGAALGCPSYLAGLSPEMAQAFTERANVAREPRLAAQLALMKHAQAKLEAAASVFVRSTDNMIGARDSTVRNLRGRREKLKTVIGAVAG